MKEVPGSSAFLIGHTFLGRPDNGVIAGIALWASRGKHALVGEKKTNKKKKRTLSRQSTVSHGGGC